MIVMVVETATATVLKKNEAGKDPIMTNPLISLYLSCQFKLVPKELMMISDLTSSYFSFLIASSLFLVSISWIVFDQFLEVYISSKKKISAKLMVNLRKPLGNYLSRSIDF